MIRSALRARTGEAACAIAGQASEPAAAPVCRCWRVSIIGVAFHHPDALSATGETQQLPTPASVSALRGRCRRNRSDPRRVCRRPTPPNRLA